MLFDFDAPKTKLMTALVDKLGAGDRKVLVLTNGAKPNVFLSGRNLPNVHVMPYSDVSTYHILWSDLVVIEEGALNGGTADTESDDDRGHEGGRGRRPRRRPRRSVKPRRRRRPRRQKRRTKRPAAKKAAKKKEK